MALATENVAQLHAQIEQLKATLDAERAEHRRTIDELLRRERQLEDAQRITHLGSWEWDIRANSIVWSDELYRIYGLKPHEFEATYSAFLSYVHPDDRTKTNQLVQQALETKGAFENEERIIRADGTERILYSCGEVMLDDHGDAVRMVGICLDVTERKVAEHKLQRLVSLLNATIEATADGILVVDSNHRLVRFNRKFAELWHFPPELVPIYGDDRLLTLAMEQLKEPEAFRAKVEQLYATPAESSFDLLEFKDGRVFERYSCPQRLGDQIVGRVWSFRDITARVCASRILAQSEQRYRSLVIASAQIVWTTDAHGDLVEDSASWREFTGQTFFQLRYRGWLDVVHPRDQVRVEELWQHAIRAGCGFDAEFRLRRADSDWRDVHARAVPVRELDGTIREWVGFGIDVTERKRAAEAVIRERDFSNAVISSLPGIFYLIDEEGRPLRWNSNLEKVTGYSSEEISKLHLLDFTPAYERELITQRVQKVFTSGEAYVEKHLVTKTGEQLPFFCTGKLVDVEGKPCLVGTGIDISARIAAENEIKRLNTELEKRVEERTAQLKEANKEMASFTYTASHDLRAPIRAIVGFARALREDAGQSLNEENLDFLDRIIAASDRMMQLIDDLLNHCRIGQQTVNFRPIVLADFIRDVAAQFESRVRSVAGDVSIAPDLPTVSADPTLLNQIFSNLLENAVNYRTKDQPLRIEVTWRDEGQNVVICVTDNGIGIAPQYHEKIFDVFQRLHSDNEYPGTGIGLATVKRSVEKLGGHVWVESEAAKGSTFCVRLRKA